ncbi:chaB2 [Orgyia leucostigma nucleopolyhedrovirus]|uniref:ChaB2 n=1 Tax=Orgyia leucostigma nucleopolyhedrovirus TaxID=490711 RepID=B0FDQ1_9ABAC|nr:chaB2 [Orgyia leucostigma nucleopolyhedrovirus]ABY65759.1 chaB2 [Orgyia leucostigma nucleopolyhedrovirus]
MKSINICDLPRLTSALPYHGKRIFFKFYNRGIRMGLSAESARRVAWVAVKRKYYKVDGCWLPYLDDNDFDTTDDDDDDNDNNDNFKVSDFETTTTSSSSSDDEE